MLGSNAGNSADDMLSTTIAAAAAEINPQISMIQYKPPRLLRAARNEIE